MPEAVVGTTEASGTGTTDTKNTSDSGSLGWRAGLPDDLKQNTDLATFKTVGEFAKHHIEVSGKVKTLETQLADAVPKLPANATDADRNAYYNALGRPEKAEGYEFDGEDKNATEWTSLWKQEFYSLGLTKEQAKQLSAKWNGQMQKMVEAHNNALKTEMTTAETKLRTEMGDKYDTNVELAKRLWQKHGSSEFDQSFANSPARFDTIRMILKLAALTGEDTSPSGTIGDRKKEGKAAFDYPNSPGMKDIGLRR